MNPYVKIEPADSPDVLLVFSDRDATRFDYETLTAQLGCSRILVRDPAPDSWFNQGIEGLGAGIAEVRDALREMINELGGGGRLLAMGSSMGGYAAILFGSLLGAERVLAFSPQTLLNRTFPIAPAEGVSLSEPDLRPVIEAAPATLVQIVTGEDDLLDLFHMARVADLDNVEPHKVGVVDHRVAEELQQAGKLASLLRTWFDTGQLPDYPSAPWLSDGYFVKAVTDGAYAFFRGDHATALSHFAPAALLYPDHAGLQHCLGISLWKLEAYAASETALRRVLRVRPGWAHAIHFLGLAIALQNRFAEAEPLFRASISLTREPWAEAHLWVGHCMDALGYPEAAEAEMRTAHQIKPSLPDPVYWLRERGLQVD